RKVSDEIRQRKREKKLQGELIVQESSPAINTSCITDLSTTSTGLVTLPEQVVEESISKESSAESAISCESFGNKQDTPPKKISYNQKVEQDLICELLEFIRCHNSTSLPNSIFSKHIPDVQVDADLTSGSILHLAHLFDKAEKTGRKEKLQWYYYSEKYEKKVVTLSSENNISDQMAKTQIYDKMELYLP
ncbi:16487_t:CDS:1, partial [Funneliformis mosseae]